MQFVSSARATYASASSNNSLEDGVHRIAEYPIAQTSSRRRKELLEIWGGDVAPDEAVDEIDIRRDVGQSGRVGVQY